jgi:uncharacterized protein
MRGIREEAPARRRTLRGTAAWRVGADLFLGARGALMKVWIDIENPPQVQYLLPFKRAFEAAGAQVLITARDYGQTTEMLADARVPYHVFGTRAGRGRVKKLVSAGARARSLLRYLAECGRPDSLLCASRAAAVAAARLRMPSYVIIDYEHVHVGIYRFTRSAIVYPDVIDPSIFLEKGLGPKQLVPVRGVKEDLTFAGVDVEAIEPYKLGPVRAEVPRVLVRPPAETSHYYRAASRELARATLAYLAENDAVVVLSPRDREQVELLDGLVFRYKPIVLTRPVPFVSLLKGVDSVVCSGGTMLREAAYLGIPAYSIFQSEIGAVDRALESMGRAKLLGCAEELGKIEIKRRGPLNRLNNDPTLLSEIVALVMTGTERAAPEPDNAALGSHQVR